MAVAMRRRRQQAGGTERSRVASTKVLIAGRIAMNRCCTVCLLKLLAESRFRHRAVPEQKRACCGRPSL